MELRWRAVCLVLGGFLWLVRPSAASDACSKQESELRTREAEACGGVAYVFNPSACYKRQRELKEFAAGPCRKAALPPVATAPASPVAAAAAPEAKPVPVLSTAPGTPAPVPPPRSAAAVDQRNEIERLNVEIAELKRQLDILKARCRQE